MSNQNTVNGFFNIPAQVVTVSTEVALLVPAAGVYPGLPSPTLPVSSGVSISAPQDAILGLGSTVDVHAFKIRLGARVVNPGAGTLTIKLYQIPAASVGVIAAAGGVTSAGAPGTGANIFHTTGALTMANPSIYYEEFLCFWSATNNNLGATHSGLQNASTVIALAAVSNALTTGVTLASALNFMPSFTFSGANAGNSVQVQEFSIDRV